MRDSDYSSAGVKGQPIYSLVSEPCEAPSKSPQPAWNGAHPGRVRVSCRRSASSKKIAGPLKVLYPPRIIIGTDSYFLVSQLRPLLPLTFDNCTFGLSSFNTSPAPSSLLLALSFRCLRYATSALERKQLVSVAHRRYRTSSLRDHP